MINFGSAQLRGFAALAALLSCAAVAMAQPVPRAVAAPARVPAGARPVDQVAAIVDNDVITMRELAQRVGMIKHRLQQQNAPVTPEDELRMQVLNQMVLERIQLQKAKDDNISIDDATLQQTLGRLAQSNGMDLATYRARIEAQGVPWDIFMRDARTELTLARLRAREVDSKITVSDAEVANYIASQRGPGAALQNNLHFEHILFKVPANADQAQLGAVQAQAEAALREALSGAAFSRLAKRDSQAPDAKNGGDLGYKAPDALPLEFVSAASTLRPGQVNPALVRTSEGFEVIRLVDRRPSRGTATDAPKLVQTRVRHILIRADEGTSDQTARERLVDIRNQIERGGDFASFAKTYSQDGSASAGGDLGWVSPGETVLEFERAMNQLQDGQISPPIRTQFGYHLIQVLGRRDAQSSPAQQMDLARQAIGQRKAKQAYADWLRQLRDSTYIEYKLGSNS